MFGEPIFQPQFVGINGVVLPASEAKIHITDLAFLRGYGIFDFLRVESGVPMFMERYLARFKHSAALLGLEIPLSEPVLIAHLYELIAANGHPKSGLKLVLTGGYSLDGYQPTSPNLVVMDVPYPMPKPQQYSEGVSLITHSYVREIPEAKTLNYIVPIRALPQIKAANAFDVLYVDGNGWITESSRSNFFLVTSDGTVVTPNERILAGVTRSVVLELAEASFKVETRPVHRDELATAQEAFITSTTKGVLGVVQVDGQIIGDGKVGDVCKMLHHAFLAFSNAYLEDAKQLLMED